MSAPPAAERPRPQLQQAYRNAEAAGVPASTLRQQQMRWQQARAAAPVRRLGRGGRLRRPISELKDQTRDARED
jgi:hypothetical protein